MINAAPSRLRLLVLAAVLLIAVAGFALTMLPRLGKSPNVPVAVPPATPSRTAPNAPVTPSTPSRSHVAKPASPAHKSTAKPSSPTAKKSGVRIGAWVPKPLARALEKHAVVIVAVGTRSSVDVDAAGEAKVGATLAGSGFLTVDAAIERQVKPFRAMLKGNFDVPTVLVVRRPGSIFVRFDGFADRQLVEQAAANAARR